MYSNPDLRAPAGSRGSTRSVGPAANSSANRPRARTLANAQDSWKTGRYDPSKVRGSPPPGSWTWGRGRARPGSTPPYRRRDTARPAGQARRALGLGAGTTAHHVRDEPGHPRLAGLLRTAGLLVSLRWHRDALPVSLPRPPPRLDRDRPRRTRQPHNKSRSCVLASPYSSPSAWPACALVPALRHMATPRTKVHICETTVPPP